MPQFSQTSIDRLRTADPRLQRLFQEVVKHLDCSVLCGHRTKAEQDAAVKAGKSKAVWPTSKHNSYPALAVDVVPYPVNWTDFRRIWHFAGFVKGMASALGYDIEWGGDWKRFPDSPHFELRSKQ